MVHKHIRVYGRVQGVGFRFYTSNIAEDLGVRGWVRNCRDGSVEIQAAASPEVMAQFVARIQQGPQFGQVDDLLVETSDSSEKWPGFSIR